MRITTRLLSWIERAPAAAARAALRGLCAALALASIGPAAAQSIGPAVEYYHAGFDHYFVTAYPNEIALLDGGAYGGVWRRTGEAFPVWIQPQTFTVDACRFFSNAFAPKSSHFYTPYAPECASRKADPVWTYEAVAFYLRLTDATGACPAGTANLYRLYNNGAGGAPNHRYTTSRTTFDQMRAAGWVPEGNGPLIVFACIPPTAVPTTPQGLWVGATATGANLYGLVQADGTFYFLYSLPNSTTIGGFVQGSATFANGAFQSTGARDFNFIPYNDDFPVALNGSYLPGSRLGGTIAEGGQSVAFLTGYVDDSAATPSLAEAAGTYNGGAGWSAGVQPATLTLSAAGVVSGASGGCTITGTAAPRTDVRAFDVSIRIAGTGCGNDTMTGIAVYDNGDRMLFAAAVNASRSDGFVFVGSK